VKNVWIEIYNNFSFFGFSVCEKVHFLPLQFVKIYKVAKPLLTKNQ